jgi:hypothetical protein
MTDIVLQVRLQGLIGVDCPALLLRRYRVVLERQV